LKKLAARFYPMRVLLDAHVHTNSSADSAITPSQLRVGIKYAGINAIAVTDHDTMEGYKRLKSCGLFSDILVLPGIELATSLGEMIILGLEDPPFTRDAYEAVAAAHQAGALVVAPHPFDPTRSSLFESCSRLGVDLVESVNGKCQQDYNRQAREFAKAIGTPEIGGSDAHEKSQIGEVVNVIECEKTVDAAIQALRKGPKTIVRKKATRF